MQPGAGGVDQRAGNSSLVPGRQPPPPSPAHHVDELGLVGGRHGHHVRQRRHVRHVKGAAVRGAVGAHQARAVHGKAHCATTTITTPQRVCACANARSLLSGAQDTAGARRRLPGARCAPTGQLLQRHVVHHLVVAALEEGRVDGAEGHQALAGQARRKRDGVLLGDAHVKHAVGVALLKPAHRVGGWVGGWVGERRVRLHLRACMRAAPCGSERCPVTGAWATHRVRPVPPAMAACTATTRLSRSASAVRESAK